jgi:phosphatidylinositol-3,4,5-trisphosphate 3-phosphatase/dual-specificity protein phosphatase PTEN
MIFSQEWSNPKDALDFYAAMRTYNKKGVTIPSQIRYVYYTGQIMNQWGGVLPKAKTLLLKSIVFNPPPKISNGAGQLM